MPDPKDWDADYRAYAREGAAVVKRAATATSCRRWSRTGCARAIRTRGGVALGGIVVGVSGAQPWFDEAFAGCIAHCLRALAKRRAQATPDALAI